MSALPSVVVCDDHQLFAESLACVLAEEGYEVAAVTPDPGAAVAAVVASDAGLCVMDLHFPGQEADGIRGARMLRAARRETAVVLLTGQDDPEALAHAVAAGVRGIVRKDQDVQTVLDTVRRVAAGQVSIPSELLRRPSGRRPPAGDAARLASFLTPREREVLALLAAGRSTAQVAAALGVATSTARTHIQSVLTVLGVHSRLEASALAVRSGLVAPDAPRPLLGEVTSRPA